MKSSLKSVRNLDAVLSEQGRPPMSPRLDAVVKLADIIRDPATSPNVRNAAADVQQKHLIRHFGNFVKR